MAFEEHLPQRPIHHNSRRFGTNHNNGNRFGYTSEGHQRIERNQNTRNNGDYPHKNVLTTNINNTNRRFNARMNTNAMNYNTNTYHKRNTNQYNSNYDRGRNTTPNGREMTTKRDTNYKDTDTNDAQNFGDLSYLSEQNLRKLTEAQPCEPTDYIPCESENNDVYNDCNPIQNSMLSCDEDDDIGSAHRYNHINNEDKQPQIQPNAQQNTTQNMDQNDAQMEYGKHEDIQCALAQLEDITKAMDLLTETVSNHASENKVMQQRVKCLQQNEIYSSSEQNPNDLHSEQKTKQRNVETTLSNVAKPRLIGKKRKFNHVMDNGYTHYNENKKRRIHQHFSG